MSRRLRKKKVLKQIEIAFENVSLEDGVSLHETLEIDDYRKVLPNSIARRLDVVDDWKRLIGSRTITKFCWNGGISFLDAKGFRFHIPAYLIVEIRSHRLGDISNTMISNLTCPNELRLDGFALFSLEQKKAIFNAVWYLHEFEIYRLDESQLVGLNEHWA